MDEFTLAVVGLQYENADTSDRRFEALLCAPGEVVHLVREPKNKHDERAIGVWSSRWVQLGYITAERCAFLGSKMAVDTHVALFQDLQRNAAYIRIRFGGSRPTMPPPRAEAPRPSEWDEYFQQDTAVPDWDV